MYKVNDIEYPFKFQMETRDGTEFNLYYDNLTSRLVTDQGAYFFDPNVTTQSIADIVSPENPGSKNANPWLIKIQLGLGCNYTCGYCMQATHVEDASKTSTRDAEFFFKRLDQAKIGFDKHPTKVELWGGEPLLYWHKILVLLPRLRERWPDVKLKMVTNGSLLWKEGVIDTLIEYDVQTIISHDGPGQHLRGPDPLDDVKSAAAINELFMRHADNTMFASVITKANRDIDGLFDWFEERMPTARVELEGVVVDYHGDESAIWSAEELEQLTNSMFMVGANRGGENAILGGAQEFYDSLEKGVQSYSLGQGCGMDREDTLSLDLNGAVMTCQNVGTEGDHLIGHIQSMDKIALDTSWHWSLREECASCPVLQLCKGSCMYLEGEEWNNSCNAEFAFHKATLAVALLHLTGSILKKIDGKMIRPPLPRPQT